MAVLIALAIVRDKLLLCRYVRTRLRVFVVGAPSSFSLYVENCGPRFETFLPLKY